MTRSHPLWSREHYDQLITDLCRADPQVRAAELRPEVRDAALRPGRSLAESVDALMNGYADRPALGERVRETVTDPETGITELKLTRRFATMTYRELRDRAGAIAAAWHHDARTPVRPGDFIATLGFASGDYTAIELASIRLGAVSVPLQPSAALGDLRAIISETGPRVLAASTEHLLVAAELAGGCPAVRLLVVFDCTAGVTAHRRALEAARSRLARAGSGTVITTLDELIATGQGLPPAPLASAGPDALSRLIYTSGSTGTPKGAMYTERLVRDMWREYWPGKAHPVIALHFAPPSHVMGTLILFSQLGCGGTVYFTARSDLSALLEDFTLVRPTELVLVPRVCEALFQCFQHALARDGGEAGQVLREIRERLLGGRVVWAGCGSAPLSAELTDFMQTLLDVPLHDAYGATETGNVFPVRDGRISPWVDEYRLADVPELGYFRTDVPSPRGELLVKSAGIVPGYFKRPDATARVFDAEGFYHTGDVMAEPEPGRLRYIDRRNNILKLSQGEFVALSGLEAVYVSSPLIRQIFVYGDSGRSHLVAVVVPVPEALHGHPGQLRAAIAESMRSRAHDAGLAAYEVPRDFLVEPDPFSVENGFLTGTRKLVRPELEKHYRGRLEDLYADIAQREASRLRDLKEGSRSRPVIDTVTGAARALLGTPGGPPDPSAAFTDLGGDSLSALEFSALLRETFGVEVPVPVVTSPARDLRAIADHIEGALRTGALKPGAARPSFASVHGPVSTVVRASDLTLEKFIGTGILARAAALPRPGTGSGPRTVLLTGANGYLGRFLCLEWLERLTETRGRLVCVVRGAGPGMARARLGDAFAGNDDLARRFRDLSGGGRLEVLPGDLGEPGLGLDEDTWGELAREADLIVHTGALVNHVLPYQQLFGPNVAGTAEVIRLALTARLTPVTYVSTIAAVDGAEETGEDGDLRVTSPERGLGDGYANGYATSKWASEVLLREVHDAFGLPVTVFRPGMILAHRRFPGQFNETDMFTRMLLSLMATGIAPGSFYTRKTPAHYDGLPVDFVAAAITALGGDGYRTYNVLNPHRDGISLDVIVDWLEDTGCVINRIGDYATWYSRFEAAVRALPERQKRRSLLPILNAVGRPAQPADGPVAPAWRFQAAVRANGVGPDGDIPHVTPELIRMYTEGLKERGLA